MGKRKYFAIIRKLDRFLNLYSKERFETKMKKLELCCGCGNMVIQKDGNDIIILCSKFNMPVFSTAHEILLGEVLHGKINTEKLPEYMKMVDDIPMYFEIISHSDCLCYFWDEFKDKRVKIRKEGDHFALDTDTEFIT